MHQFDDRLIDPFRQGVLPALPVSTLAHLRATCRQLKQLVDEQTGPVWTRASASLLPAEALPTSLDGPAIQLRLSQHADVLKHLSSGGSNSILRNIISISGSEDVGMYAWSPIAKKYLAHRAQIIS